MPSSSSDSFNGVDLSRLPAPVAVEALDYEAIRTQLLALFAQLWPGFDATVESDPVVKLIELFAYRELVLRSRINDSLKAVMVAYAAGADLEHLAALFGVSRLTITPADPEAGTPAVLESDDALRRRLVLAPEGFSVAGPEGAYIFHALSADSHVTDASATSPAPGEVVVTVLSSEGDGTATAPVLAAVEARLNDDAVRPMTDQVTVQAAEIIPYAIEAEITFLAGPDSTVVMDQAQARLDAWISSTRLLGRDVTRAGIIAALHPEGVQNVALISPAADIVLTRLQAGYCTAITITNAGTGE